MHSEEVQQMERETETWAERKTQSETDLIQPLFTQFLVNFSEPQFSHL